MPRIERPKYLNQLINRMGNGMVKIITGLRRGEYKEFCVNVSQ